MKRNWKRVLICAAIALGSAVVTLLLSNIRFFQVLDLKARDAHFVFRGKVPTKDIILIGIDDKALNNFPELFAFWHPYYADAFRAVADAGAKVMVLDVAFGIPVTKWEPDNDSKLAEAYTYATQKMGLVTAMVASTANQKDANFTIPINMLAGAFGSAAYANLTADSDDFVRRQELLEAPKAGVPTEQLTRSMPFMAAEKFLGKPAQIKNGQVFLGDRLIPTNGERDVTINFAGPADTFPRISLFDVIQAYRSGNTAQLTKWFSGKVVLMGPDNMNDRYSTPFYKAAASSSKWTTPGVEIHANTLHTLLTGDFLLPVPEWVRFGSLLIAAGIIVSVVTSFPVAQTALWSVMVFLVGLVFTHVLFRNGWLLSTTENAASLVLSLIGGIIYRFATAEKKSSFFKNAVALFVGKQVAQSLDKSDKIGLTGKREMVTILFTDIRGFTAFCESKDPAQIVDLLNVYMSTMVRIIVDYHGHVNKFIGDGILAVFSDDDEGAKPGDHALRSLKCAVDMVNAPSEFKTGAGMHSGEVIIGNVGSSDKMEFTVLGDTVNLASRLESLNKENKTKVLLSEATLEMCGGVIDTLYLGAVPVRGKTEPMKLYTVMSLVTAEIREKAAHAAAEAAAK